VDPLSTYVSLRVSRLERVWQRRGTAWASMSSSWSCEWWLTTSLWPPRHHRMPRDPTSRPWKVETGVDASEGAPVNGGGGGYRPPHACHGWPRDTVRCYRARQLWAGPAGAMAYPMKRTHVSLSEHLQAAAGASRDSVGETLCAAGAPKPAGKSAVRVHCAEQTLGHRVLLALLWGVARLFGKPASEHSASLIEPTGVPLPCRCWPTVAAVSPGAFDVCSTCSLRSPGGWVPRAGVGPHRERLERSERSH
jgi:hypothetical protein